MIKMYKKLLAILMAITVSCSCAVMNVSAEGEGDVAGEIAKTLTQTPEDNISPQIRKMMDVLRTFSIIPDYYDYNVPLTYEVPRSDFAASVARMMGKTAYGGSEVYFYDVPKNYWAFNEISNLTQMGIINGAGDKLFHPSDPITKGAAYKMLLCAMGYSGYAERMGGYPTGYTSTAAHIKLSSGVSSSDKVTMSDMLYILYNALTVNIMKVKSSTGTAMTYEVSDDETLVSTYRDIYYDEGNVNGANSIVINGGTLKDNATLIGAVIYNSEGFNMIDYLGEKVEFFYEDKGSSDEKKILWVGLSKRASSEKTKTISVDGDAQLDTNSFVYTYYDEKDRKQKITLDKSILLVYNGSIVDSGYDRILNNKRYQIKLVSNNGRYTVMIVRAYEDYVVGNINTVDRIIYDKNRPHEFISLNDADYDTFSLRVMGNDEMPFEDLKEGAVLSVYRSKDNKHIEAYVSYGTVTGEIEYINTKDYTKVSINGNPYRVDDRVPTTDYSTGDDVTAYTDIYGEIAYIKVNTGSAKGAFLLKAILDDREDAPLVIKLLGEDSNVSRIPCAKKLIIDGVRYTTAKDAYNAILAGENKLTAQFALIKLDQNGEIREIDTATYNEQNETSNSLQIDVPFWYGGETTYTQRLIRANANAARIGEKIVFDANTKVFIVPFVTDYDNVRDDDLWVTTGSRLANDTGTYVQSYKTSENIGITKYLLLKGYDPNRVNAEMPVLAQEISRGIDEDGNPVEVLEGYQGAAPVSIKADESVSSLFTKSGVRPGDVVTLTKDSYGHVKGCTVVYDYRTGEHKAISALNDIVGLFAGYAHSVVDNVVKIGFTSGAECDFAINAMSRPVLVYDTSKTINAISAGTTGDIVTYLNDPEKCSTVFIVTNRMQPQMFIIYR